MRYSVLMHCGDEACWQAQAGYAETTDTISQRLSVLLPADYQFYTPYKVILPTPVYLHVVMQVHLNACVVLNCPCIVRDACSATL